ncbi:MFS transporter [Spartinivicinus poritis]|uniref:MFS transporter n=1 Tax=Spartinivicinus poritis TaxID=2994640 RepID=A0ABT5U4H5_9GAMM|nr:MFS transporter [Spartinivicinus sp. A2-2]MDE1460876.1 MFS transporter [Spartinivicinus sp. A2-2]
MLISPLTDRRYRHLFSAQVIALFGSGLTTVALALLAHQLAGGEAGKVLGFALALKMVAYVVISPLISAFIQHFPRRAILVTLDLLRAAVVLVLPWVTEVWQIYLLVFLLNVFSAGFTPVFQATIPDIIKNKAQYTKALSLSRLAYDLENLLSPMAAAALITLMSFNMLFLLNTVAFLISAALVVTISIPDKVQHNGDLSFWSRANQGMKIYFKTPRLRGLLALFMAVAAAGAMQIVNTVVYVRTELDLGESWVALAFAAVGGGSMLAAFSIPFILKKLSERQTMLIGGSLMGVSMLLGLTLPEINVLLVLWWLIGVGTSMILTPVGQLLTLSCQESDRPAVFAAQFSLSHACWLIAYPLAGWLGAQFGMTVAFGVLGLTALISVGVAAGIWPKHDQYELEHTHEANEHNHWHVHDEHHQHDHEGWEGPESHSHPHRHTAVKHIHPFVIDDHHSRWP